MAKICAKCHQSFSNSKIAEHVVSCTGKPEADDLAKTLGVNEEAPETKKPKAEVKAEGGEKVEPVADTKPVEATDMEAVIRKMVADIPDEALREKAQTELTKLYNQDSATKMAKGWVKFDEDFKPAVEKLITELVEKHGLKPEKQRITITFPDGKASYSRGLKGKGSNGGTSNREGFPAQWGKAMVGDKEFGSPSKMAEALGCQVNGKGAGYSDMVDVFEKQGHPVMELPAGKKLDELVGKQTDPERKKRLEKLSGKVFRVKP